jgi:hypothetical protein
MEGMKRIIDFDKLAEREAELIRELQDIKLLKECATKYGVDVECKNQKNDAPPPAPTPNGSRPEAASGFRHVDSAVRAAITTIERGKEFTSVDIRGILAENAEMFNASSVSTVLSKLKEDAQIIPVAEGAGRRPTIYKKSEHFIPVAF